MSEFFDDPSEDIQLPDGPVRFVSESTADIYKEIADRASAELAELRDRIERALGALSQPNASNYERAQAAGLILTVERPLEKDSAMSASRRKRSQP